MTVERREPQTPVFSLKWKLMLIFGVLVVLLFATFALFNHHNLQRQYDEQQQQVETRALEQFTGLLAQSHSELLGLVHLLPALAGVREAMRDGDGAAIGERFSASWGSLQVDSDLVIAGFFDADGRPLSQSYALGTVFEYPASIEASIVAALEGEQPQVGTDCTQSCLLYAITPVLSEGRVVGAVLLGRTLSSLVWPFQQVSQLDVALLFAATEEEAAAVRGDGWDTRLRADGGHLVAATRREAVTPLLDNAATRLRSAELRPAQRISARHGGRQFELMPLAFNGYEGALELEVVAINDVTQAREQIAAAQRQSVGIGVVGLLAFSSMVVLFMRPHLSRLRRTARLLPLLAEQQFATVRGQLAGRRQRLPDELGLLEQTTLGLADRLEHLEQEVQKRNRALATKVEELAVERERYQLAAAGANDGLWDWDLTTEEIYYSPRWRAIVGQEETSIAGATSEWFDRVHPDDRERLLGELDDHLAARSAWLESEHRLRHERGGYRWVRVRGLAVRGDDGSAHRMAGSMTDITEERRIQEQLRQEALYDGLTGLANRSLFLDRLGQAISRAQRARSHFAVLLIGIDHFKTINESLGHVEGDHVLIQVGQRLTNLIGSASTLARLGGDEFGLLLEEISGVEEVERLVEQVQNAQQRPLLIAERELFANVTIGIATGSGREGVGPEELLRNANTAMHQAKIERRGGRAFFNTTMHASAVRRLTLETAMRHALEREAFELHYQPIVTLSDGRLDGFEALARWPRDDGQPVSPADFIPLAEQNGLIIPLGRWVIRAAVAQAAAWFFGAGAGWRPPLAVSINVSGKQLRDPELVATLQGALREHGLPGSCIKVELTESAVIESGARALEIMRALKELGVALAIDDFGTGYSSLSQLRDLPFDVVKIDRSFVHRLTTDEGHRAIVEGVVQIAQALAKTVVAEGVETGEQAQQLRQLGCDFGQGYLFARPREVEAIEEVIDNGPARFRSLLSVTE